MLAGVPERLDGQRHRRRHAAALHRRLHHRGLPARPRRRARAWAATSRPRTTQPGAEKVAIIGYGIWQRDFGGAAGHRRQGRPHQRQAGDDHRRDAAGLRVSRPTRSCGSRSTASSRRGRATIRAQHQPGRRSALLKPGVSLDQANAEFTALRQALRRRPIPTPTSSSTPARSQPLIETFTPRPLRGTLLTMLGFCVGVLLIACVNVMNMQFARATLRAKELAVRSSLGATRVAPDPADAHREPAASPASARSLGIGLAYCRHRLAVGDRPQPRQPAARPGSPSTSTRRCSPSPSAPTLVAAVASGPAAGLDVVARERRRRAARTAAAATPAAHRPRSRAASSSSRSSSPASC